MGDLLAFSRVSFFTIRTERRHSCRLWQVEVVDGGAPIPSIKVSKTFSVDFRLLIKLHNDDDSVFLCYVVSVSDFLSVLSAPCCLSMSLI